MYVVLGVVGGLGSVVFVKLLLGLRKAFARPAAIGRCGFSRSPADCAVGTHRASSCPQVLGVGYDQVERALSGDLVLRAVVLLAVLKIVATAVCYASGNAGGIFGPSLFIGAMMGGAGRTASRTSCSRRRPRAPARTRSSAWARRSPGIIRTPLTSVIMIFEVTRDYTIIVPLMISNLIAFYISQKLQREPIYEALARQDGLHLPTRRVSHVVATTASERRHFRRLRRRSRLNLPCRRQRASDWRLGPRVMAGRGRRGLAGNDSRSGHHRRGCPKVVDPMPVRELLDASDQRDRRRGRPACARRSSAWPRTDANGRRPGTRYFRS